MVPVEWDNLGSSGCACCIADIHIATCNRTCSICSRCGCKGKLFLIILLYGIRIAGVCRSIPCLRIVWCSCTCWYKIRPYIADTLLIICCQIVLCLVPHLAVCTCGLLKNSNILAVWKLVLQLILCARSASRRYPVSLITHNLSRLIRIDCYAAVWCQVTCG